jgi:divalent metal cation (Fe/Co/Zn/Cd) transporter
VEYLTSLIIAILILFTGGEFLISSIKLVIKPEP